MRVASLLLLASIFGGSRFMQETMNGKDRQNTVPTEISFRLGGPSKPVVLVPASINGKGPYLFALDTGAGQTVLSSELANELGLKQGEKKEAVGAGGKVSVSMSMVDSIAIGAAKVDNLSVVITDLSLLRMATGEKLDGILGYNYLKNFRVTIDYPKKLLRLE